jgi:hypothetical protein
LENTGNSKNNKPLPSNVRALTRREWAQRMVAGAGAGLAAPALAEAGWDTPAVQANLPAEAAGAWKPSFFDDTQNQTLILLAERIVPGSTSVQVNRFLDLAMSASTQENQRKFVAAMNAMEGESLRQFTKAFAELTPGQQDEVLQAASTAQLSESDSASSAAKPATEQPAPPTLREHFDILKGWISSAYYSTEVGMKELGWTGENFFESFPGCEHPNGHS